jgi:hypothetical protein
LWFTINKTKTEFNGAYHRFWHDFVIGQYFLIARRLHVLAHQNFGILSHGITCSAVRFGPISR